MDYEFLAKIIAVLIVGVIIGLFKKTQHQIHVADSVREVLEDKALGQTDIEYLKSIVNYLSSKIEFVDNYSKPFTITRNYLNILDKNVSKDILSKIALEMLNYINIKNIYINVDLVFVDVNTNNYCGQMKYDGIRYEVTLIIDKYSNRNTILAVLAHEISHIYMQIKNINISSNIENELLTDICAIYLGFDSLILQGYKKNIKSVNDNYSDVNVSYNTVGYIEINEITIVKEFISEIIDKKANQNNYNQKILVIIDFCLLNINNYNIEFNLIFKNGRRFLNNKNSIEIYEIYKQLYSNYILDKVIYCQNRLKNSNQSDTENIMNEILEIKSELIKWQKAINKFKLYNKISLK